VTPFPIIEAPTIRADGLLPKSLGVKILDLRAPDKYRPNPTKDGVRATGVKW
jgi:hypothetical protein